MMRIEGTVKTWNDERAFGFIAPAQGGEDIFVHVTAFVDRSRSPALNQRVSFEVARGPDGKKRANKVSWVGPAGVPAANRRAPRRKGVAQWGGASLFVIPAFLVIYLLLAWVWKVPYRVGLGFLVLSIICFVAYAADKSAARSGAWRISESTLLWLGLLGGWPGAVLAQQWLRHKSTKPSFRSAFWLTVVVNVTLFVALSSPKFSVWNFLR
jgi:uncharacterized membrane protein YsdA (DUF1294 family)/cold shock CspA family protein